jgi:hypothetical protein
MNSNGMIALCPRYPLPNTPRGAPYKTPEIHWTPKGYALLTICVYIFLVQACTLKATSICCSTNVVCILVPGPIASSNTVWVLVPGPMASVFRVELPHVSQGGMRLQSRFNQLFNSGLPLSSFGRMPSMQM